MLRILLLASVVLTLSLGCAITDKHEHKHGDAAVCCGQCSKEAACCSDTGECCKEAACCSDSGQCCK